MNSSYTYYSLYKRTNYWSLYFWPHTNRNCLGLNLSNFTVRYTISQELQRDNGVSSPKASRRRKYIDANERLLLCYVRNNPKDTYEEVISACNLDISRETIRKILKKYNITNWVSKRRPLLTEIHAAKRLAWCLAQRH